MSRVSSKYLIQEYILHEYARLEQDIQDIEKSIRWGSYTAHDVAHLQLLKTRFEAFKDFSNHIMILLSITDVEMKKAYEIYRKKIKNKDISLF